MRLFGRRQEPPPEGLMAQLVELRSLVENLSSEVRVLRLELSAQSDLVTKRMRRAVAAERAVERNQERRENPGTDVARAATPAPPASAVGLWGARARIAARRARAATERAAVVIPAAENGTGPEDEPEEE